MDLPYRLAGGTIPFIPKYSDICPERFDECAAASIASHKRGRFPTGLSVLPSVAPPDTGKSKNANWRITPASAKSLSSRAAIVPINLTTGAENLKHRRMELCSRTFTYEDIGPAKSAPGARQILLFWAETMQGPNRLSS